MNSNEGSSGVQVNVLEWKDGTREVGVYLKAFDQMISVDANGARNLAFLLMECADFIEPPFETRATQTEEGIPDDDSESVAFFGPYEDKLQEVETEDDEEDEEEDS